MKEKIESWENLTNYICKKWIRKYFEIDKEEEDVAFYWIGDDVGSIFEVSDYCFDFNNVLDCYKHNITPKELWSWYDFCLTSPKIKLSLVKSLLLPQERKEQEQKELKRCKENVEFAKKELEKALDNYEK